MTEKEGYIPGACNIGKEEIKGRKKALIMGIIIAVLCVALIQGFHVNHLWRLLLFIPFASVVISLQQVYMKFCVNFGMRGVFNFGDMGKTFSVEQKEYFKKDRAKALQMIITGIVTGVVIAVVYYFLPV